MTTTVPDVIRRYFDATNARDSEALVACFATDAVATDEGKTYTGLDEIRGWRAETVATFEYTSRPISAEPVGEGAGTDLVTSRVEGNFPGSPVDLKFRFALADDAITRLDIAP
jgi:ketosteroid isomerase-like protein